MNKPDGVDSETEIWVTELARALAFFSYNYNRIRRLQTLSLSLGEVAMNQLEAKGLQAIADMNLATEEIYRAIIILLHASFEDVLREIARIKLLQSPKRAPLNLAWPDDKREKLTLAEVVKKHVSESVQDIFQKSVDRYLNDISVSKVDNVVKLLDHAGLDPDMVLKGHKSSLASLIDRRHRIVHWADKGGAPLNKVDYEEIGNWIVVVNEIVGSAAVQAVEENLDVLSERITWFIEKKEAELIFHLDS